MTKVKQIQAEIDNKNAAIDQEKLNGQQTNHEQVTQWENEISVLQMQLSDAKAEEAQQSERVQAQTEKVESITLPLDFNDLLDNPLANEMIIEVVKQFQLQAYDEHNAEIQRLSIAWNQSINESNRLSEELLRVAEEHKAELQTTISSLTYELESEKSMYGELEANYAHIQTLLNQANLEKADAETKRDNAVKELAQVNIEYQHKEGIENELKAQVESLQQELAAKKALTVNGNDKLADLAKQAKESTIEKANRGLARWNLPAIEVPSMPAAEAPAMPEIPAAQEEHPKDEVSDGNAEGNSAVEGNTAIPQSLGERTASAEETPVTRSEHEALAARVATIERHANIQAAA